MNTNLLIAVVAVLGSLVVVEGAIICFLILNRKKFAKKVKKQNSDKSVAKREKVLRNKIADLYGEIERLEKQYNFYKKEAIRYKEKAADYAYAMEEITSLYRKACETISDYVQEGILIKNFSDSKAAYEEFSNTWRDLQVRKYVETYKLENIINDPQDLENLFGTSDMGFLSEVFEKVEA